MDITQIIDASADELMHMTEDELCGVGSEFAAMLDRIGGDYREANMDSTADDYATAATLIRVFGMRLMAKGPTA